MMRLLPLLTLTAILQSQVAIAEDAQCNSTVECAQRMVMALAGLNETDDALKETLAKLAKEIVRIEAEADAADAAQLKTAKAYTAARVNGIGKGADVTPKWGNGTTDICPKGQYMVGAKVHSADGDHAGLLYGLKPICRAFK